jgi:hypothetical protein
MQNSGCWWHAGCWLVFVAQYSLFSWLFNFISFTLILTSFIEHISFTLILTSFIEQPWQPQVPSHPGSTAVIYIVICACMHAKYSSVWLRYTKRTLQKTHSTTQQLVHSTEQRCRKKHYPLRLRSHVLPYRQFHRICENFTSVHTFRFFSRIATHSLPRQLPRWMW